MPDTTNTTNLHANGFGRHIKAQISKTLGLCVNDKL